MGKKKKEKKQELASPSVLDLEAQVKRLRQENIELRERLERIAELAHYVPSFEIDEDEEDEYEELSNDVDDLIDGSKLEHSDNAGKS